MESSLRVARWMSVALTSIRRPAYNSVTSAAAYGTISCTKPSRLMTAAMRSGAGAR